MVRNPVARANGAAVLAALVALIVVAGLGNQALQSWRDTQASSGGGESWTADVFKPLELTAWRFSAAGGESSSHWLAPLVFNGAFIILSFLLVDIATRDAGRLSVFFGTWAAVTLAAGGAGLISTPLAFQGVAGPASADYPVTLTEGLVLGFLVGFVAAVVAGVLAGRGARTVLGTPSVTTD
jgi:hypothetical protein